LSKGWQKQGDDEQYSQQDVNFANLGNLHEDPPLHPSRFDTLPPLCKPKPPLPEQELPKAAKIIESCDRSGVEKDSPIIFDILLSINK